MKKILVFILSICIALPGLSQKMSKEEKEAMQKALYDTAVKCINEKDFVIIPTSYIDSDGIDESLTDNTIFILYDTKNMYMQGKVVCGNGYTNIADVTEYSPNFDKKGNLKLRIVVNGRMVRGTYLISMRANTNIADVIFTPQNGTTRKFQGPIVPVSSGNFIKRSNVM